MTAEYRWAHPSEWLHDYINELANRDQTQELERLARNLADLLDGDQIQDLFQTEMDEDGYFRPVRKGRRRS